MPTKTNEWAHCTRCMTGLARKNSAGLWVCDRCNHTTTRKPPQSNRLWKASPSPKFKNKKVTGSDGFVYDSEFEYHVYLDLCQEYAQIWRQVPFYLMPPVTVGYHVPNAKPRKKVISQRKYIMDFVVYRNGAYIAIEAKGVATDVWTLKRDLLIWQYIANQKAFDCDGVKILAEYHVIYQKKPREVFTLDMTRRLL